MALTDITLIWLGSLATLATLGVFYRFAHVLERALVTFTAAALWGLFGLASTNVLVPGSSGGSLEPMWPLAWVGFGLAAITALYGFYDVLQGARDEVKDADLRGMAR